MKNPCRGVEIGETNVRDEHGGDPNDDGLRAQPEVPVPWGAHAANVCTLDRLCESCGPSEDSPRIPTWVQRKDRSRTNGNTKQTKKKKSNKVWKQELSKKYSTIEQ